MPARARSRAPCALLAVLALTCCAVGAVGAAISGLDALGPASPTLGPSERIAIGLVLVASRGSLLVPAGEPDRAATLDVEPGMDAGAVTLELSRLGVLKNPGLMSRYLHYRGLDTQIEAGRYEVNGGMSIVELADLLQRAQTSRYTITVPEGWRSEQIAESVGSLDLPFTAEDFLQATRRSPPDWSLAPADALSLEGFLFPDTYQLSPSMAPEEVVGMMVADLEGRLTDELLGRFAAQGLTPFEALTLASIVEREAAVASERPLIASVFLNRLRLDIPLQADPTVQYPLGGGDQGWWKAPLTAEDLQLDSPYNTYLVHGLPPGPIASPGWASIESVAFPAETGYLFFRAACDGSGRHVFATTFEEHVANACR